MVNSWYIIHVGDPRRMRHLSNAIKLVTLDYALWIPTKRIIQQTRGKNVEVDRLLFPGYAFVKFSINPKEAENSIKAVTGGYFLTLPGTDEPSIVSDIEIQYLKSQELKYQSPKSVADNYNLEEGQTVEIKNGPFIGTRGIIKQIKRSKVVVEVRIFERGVLAEVDPSSCHVSES